MFIYMKEGRRLRHLWLFQFFADFAAICTAYYLTYFLRFHSDAGDKFFTFVNQTTGVRDTGVIGGSFETFYIVSGPRIVIILTCALSLLYALFNLYSDRRFMLKRSVSWNVIQANVLALVVFYVYFYLQRNTFHPRSYFVTVLFLNVILCVLFRSWMDSLLQYLRGRYGIDKHTAVVVGSSKEADYIQSVIDVLHPHGLELVGRVATKERQSFDDLIIETGKCLLESQVDMMVVADKAFSISEIMRFMELADKMGLSVKVLSDKMDVLQNRAKIPADLIHGVSLVHFDQPTNGGVRRAVSNVASRLAAVMLLVIFFPLMILVALLIKLTSRGPVFFVQERIGVNRKPFSMYKFRTMYDKADEVQAQLEEFNETNGIFKIKKDPRVTPAGRFLRRFSLDELPQLFNVIKGDMRIVGPRPLPKRDFANYYEEWHYGRHGGLPGLTCLWQVSGRSDIDFHNMCILDVYYLRNRSWVLDVKIFIKTVWVVLFGQGAY